MKQQERYDYLFISAHFGVLARSSWRNYIDHPYSGALTGNGRSLPEAIKIANSVMKASPGKYHLGLRISDGAVEKQIAIDRQKRPQYF